MIRTDTTAEYYLDAPRQIEGITMFAGGEIILHNIFIREDTSDENGSSQCINSSLEEITLPAYIAGEIVIRFNQSCKAQGIIIDCDHPEKIMSIEAIETGYEQKRNKIITWGSNPSDTQYPSAKLVHDSLSSGIQAEAQTRAQTDNNLMSAIQAESQVRAQADEARELISNKITSWGTNPTDTQYPSAKLVHDSLGGGGKQFYWLPDLTPPMLSDFSWINQGTATADQNNGALYMSDAPSASGDKLRMLVKPLSSQIFDVTIGFNSSILKVANQMIGLCLYNSLYQNSIFFSLRHDYRIEYIKFYTPTSWNTTTYYNYIGTATIQPIFWMRLTQDANFRKIYISVDGIHWGELYSTSKSDFITPEKIGLCINPYANQRMQALFVHWSLLY
ncbi:MAG: hypothetical protein KBG83_00200 [Bacteroidetes bacterium]|nr:hypothetical protein [Bacteroidota bacterium]